MKKGVPVFDFEKPEKKETVESPADQEITESETRYGIIINSPFVSVREYADETAPVKDYIQSGEEVEIEGSSNEFFQVRFGRTHHFGFISKNFVREVH